MLGRIVLMLGADKALFVRRTWLTQIFVTGDVICFLCQAGGAGLLSSGNLGLINTGNDIIVAGLFIQVVFFGLFVICRIIPLPTRQIAWLFPEYRETMEETYGWSLYR
jgi:hypothetical protein